MADAKRRDAPGRYTVPQIGSLGSRGEARVDLARRLGEPLRCLSLEGRRLQADRVLASPPCRC